MPRPFARTTRRDALCLLAGLPLLAAARPAAAAVPSLSFDELYSKFGVLGLEFSER